MSANTNTDLTEEDAADLQFPKEKRKNVNFLYSDMSTKCSNCTNDLSSIYIMCDECDLNICTKCFANGSEFSSHKNNHNYRVFTDQFKLLQDSTWTAREELTLLNGLITLGNWPAIQKTLPKYTLEEIKTHYDVFYLNRKGSSLLPSFSNEERYIYNEPIIPYRFKTLNVFEPPRAPMSIASSNMLAGYSAARSDFEYEYDANAEDLICNLKVPDANNPYYHTLVDLQYAIFKMYNNRLKERMRRKKIIRKHGLILTRKVNAWLHRYDTTVTQNVYDRMTRFMQFCSGERFEYIMEGLHRAGELKIQIARLCDYRKCGITTLAGANLYLNLKPIQEEHQKKYKAFQGHRFFKSDNENEMTISTKKRRGDFTPIEIIGMPGYEKLNIKERELCRKIRLVPVSYLEFKDLLVQENNKSGYLKLATARRQIKIDVNKTRRLYDFLIQEGYVNKPPK